MGEPCVSSLSLSEAASREEKTARFESDRKSRGPLINAIRRAIEEKRPYYSFEFFPPKTPAGVSNLFNRIERMAMLEPMFVDVTWGVGGNSSQLTLDIASNIQQFCSVECMLHLTCTNMTEATTKQALETAKKCGIRNILALRGDPPRGLDQWEQCPGGFAHAVDLVKFIRKEYGDYFGIAVSGYPEGHVAAVSREDDIKRLREKIEAGADFVMTQLFYDVDIFFRWVDQCRAAGITCPIIPGIMPIQNFNGFKLMTSFCKTSVPGDILANLEAIQHDDARVKQYGIDLAIQTCQRLLAGGVLGLHFYTLNLERSVAHILEGLGFVSHKRTGALPWKQSLVSRRAEEDVRPIFWANRPQSYLDRTVNWDDFPNGRWGNSASPAFGELLDYHLCSIRTGTREERLQIWCRAPTSAQDIYGVFANYIDGQIKRLPWCENPIQLETVPIKECLRRMNHKGYLTINSQPRVNGAPSSDPAVGWGEPNGFVYQKAYLEFFCSPANLDKMILLLVDYPHLQFTAVNQLNMRRSNNQNTGANAVTWGVFPGKEIIQPTVVEDSTFVVWKDEAFALWLSQWKAIYESSSNSASLIQDIHDTFYLVNLVDNDYINGDIFGFFDRVMQHDGKKEEETKRRKQD